MSLTYCKFIFLNTIRRKSVWITWLLYLIACLLLIIVLPLGAKLNTLQFWANTSMPICQTFVGITIAIFTAILAIAIFKNTRDEGTELIIIAKPITRFNTVISKFLVFFLFCLIVNISAVILSVFTIFLPFTEPKFYWGLVLSMFIGNLTTFAIFGAVSILFSIRFVKAGIIVGNVVLALVLLVYQIITSFVLSSTMTTLTDIRTSNIKIQSYVLPVRQDDGSYTEENFVSFIALTNEQNEYDLKVKDWQGVKDYWENDKAKNNQDWVIATDIGSQLALSYLSVNADKYSDRQAQRMYNFSRYYDYVLTKPASSEYYENNSNLKMLYVGDSYNKTYQFYYPSSYVFPGVRSTKSSYLKGTITNVIPVADLKSGDSIFAHSDVTFEKDEWTKYKPIFDTMYDNVFRYDIKNGNGGDYYSYTLATESQNFNLNSVWCTGTTNLNRYYKLIWACLTGHHGDNEYFGSNDPLKKYTIKDLNINSVRDLNSRFLQFKDYCFNKAYDQQHELIFNGLNDAQWAIEQNAYKEAKESLQKRIDDNKLQLVQTGTGIGERGFIIRANKDSGAILIQPGTQTINNNLLRATAEQLKAYYLAQGLTSTSPEWIDSAINGSYATWLKTSNIGNRAYCNEDYLFESLETPDRSDSITSEQYLTSQTWIPYIYNYQAYEDKTYYPYGQNLQFSFYECNRKVSYWQFALIWCLISAGLYVIPVVVYSKYDIK